MTQVMPISALIERQCGVQLPFLDATNLKEAQRRAYASAKFLLIYIHCASHPDAVPFVTDVLGDIQMTALFRDNVMLFGVHVHDAAGCELASHLQLTTFPYCALCLKSDIIFDIQGKVDTVEFLKELRLSMDEWYPAVAKEISMRHERESARKLREREETEMQETIRIDTERLAKYERDQQVAKQAKLAQAEAARILAMEEDTRRLQEQRAAEEQRLAQARQLEQEQHAKEALDLMKAVAMSALPEEPSVATDPASMTTISVRTFTGKSYERRFLRESLVKHLMLFASSTEAYDGRAFHLAAGFPPKRVDAGEDTPIGNVPALVPRSVVVMRDGP